MRWRDLDPPRGDGEGGDADQPADCVPAQDALKIVGWQQPCIVGGCCREHECGGKEGLTPEAFEREVRSAGSILEQRLNSGEDERIGQRFWYDAQQQHADNEGGCAGGERADEGDL